MSASFTLVSLRLNRYLALALGAALVACAAPLVGASQDGDVARVKELLKAGANPNAEDAGYSALHFAALEGHAAVLAALLEGGANPNVATKGVRGGYTPLHYAAMKGHMQAVVVLLDGGADPAMQAEGKTARQLAAVNGFAEVAQRLADTESSRAGGAPSTVVQAPPQLVKPRSLLVLPLRSEGGVADQTPAVLTKVLLTELQSVRGMQTHSVDDLNAILGVERQKDLLGCDSTTCMAELAGALGTDLVLYGSLGRLGTSISWSISVLEPATGRVAARASLTSTGAEDALAAKTRSLVADVVIKLNEAIR